MKNYFYKMSLAKTLNIEIYKLYYSIMIDKYKNYLYIIIEI